MKYITISLCLFLVTIQAHTIQAQTYTKVDLIKLYAQEWGFLTYYTSASSENEKEWFDLLTHSLKELDLGDNPKRFKELSDTLLLKVKFPDNKFNPDWQIPKSDTLLNPNLYSWMNDSLFDDVVKLKLNIIKQNPVITPSCFRPRRYLGEFSDSAIYLSNSRKAFPVNNKYEALAGLVVFWNAANYYCAYPIGRKYEWGNVLNEFIPQFITLKECREHDYQTNYRNLMQQVVAKLGDSHSLQFAKTYGIQGYVQVDYIDSICYVVKIHPKLSVLYHIKPGDIILEKDGRPMTAIYKELEKYFCASNPLETNYNILPNLLTFDNPSRSTHLKLKKPDKSIFETDIKYNSLPSLKEKKFEEYRSWHSYKGTYSNYSDTIFNDSICYINVCIKTDKSLKKKLKEFSTKKYLILDFRDYPFNVNFAFTTSKKKCYYSNNNSIPNISNTRVDLNKTPGHFQKEAKFLPRPIDRPGLIKWEHYGRNKNIYLLCTEYTKSKSEWLLMYYYAITKGLVIGRNTAGVPSGVGIIYLPGKFCTLMTLGEAHDYKNRLISGKGIEPDVYIKKDINSIINGEDYILNKTLELIYKK